jgi:hypothetical protein
MTDRLATLKAAIAKLEKGGWSLTVDGFARRALRMKAPLSFAERAELKALMNATGLPPRRILVGMALDVWDYQA